METIKQQIENALLTRQDELVKLAQALIRFPSIKGREAEAQNFFAAKLRELGADVEAFEPDVVKMRNLPGYVSERQDFDSSPVVAGVLKGLGGGHSLILCGHMDVVAPGVLPWTYGPWNPVVKEGKLYGRGSVDMKGGIAAHYMAVKVLLDMGLKPKGDIIFLSTIDEECGSTGILALLNRGYRAEAAICTEPVSLKITLATQGSTWFRIKISGKSAHAGVAYEGVNAIYKAIPIIERIRSLEEERRIRLHDRVPMFNQLPTPYCVGINMISGGTWPAMVPDEVVLEGRLGFSPLETPEEVRSELEATVHGVALADPWLKSHPPRIEYYQSRWNSGMIEKDHPFVQCLHKNQGLVLGKKEDFVGMFACSDSGSMVRLGQIPSLDFGPGPQQMAHKTDEYVLVEDLVKTAQIIALTIIDWCGYSA